jgi:argininosuccinate lyase
MSQAHEKPWGGRFSAPTAELMERFNASIGFDRKLLEVDVAGSIAYARALHRAEVLSAAEAERIVVGLERTKEELQGNEHLLGSQLEDVHMAVERHLTELIGPLGGKLHTGRSRNDQVSLDERMYLRLAIAGVSERVRGAQSRLVESAERYPDVVLPGYTHLQPAQPILFGHYALSLFWMLQRDHGRLSDAWARADIMPLGSGALAGSTFPIDRDFLAAELGFSRVSENSIDAVSDRDFILETVSALSILMMHLSRFCEDLIVWSSREFGFLELDDAFSTGSSMMPQKKNPDSLELIRGKCGRVYGDLMSLLTTMKGIPLTYSKDMQEDKEPLFDAIETSQICLEVFAGAWSTMRLYPKRMEAALDGQMLATDLADYLVGKGMSFRDAHGVVGNLVRTTEAEGQTIATLSPEALKRECVLFDADVIRCLDVRSSLESRNIPGGTGPGAVAEQLRKARGILS